MPVRKGKQRPDIGPRQVLGARDVGMRADGAERAGAACDQESVFEQLPFGKLDHADRQGEDRRVQATRLEVRQELFPGSLHHGEFDARRRVLQTLQKARQQVRRQGGNNPDRDQRPALVELFPHELQEIGLVQDPERLFMRLPAQPGEVDAPALPLDERPAQRRLQFANLER